MSDADKPFRLNIDVSNPSMTMLRFQENEMEQAFHGQLREMIKEARLIDAILTFCLLTLCILFSFNDLLLTVVLLTIWLYSRWKLKFIDVFAIAFLQLYIYLGYALLINASGALWLELLMLVMVNFLCIYVRYLFESTLRIFFMKNRDSSTG